jgi:glycosyltransferase involved in cell wall biosynthesis
MTQKVYWVEPDRFERKPNKSPWLEMAKVLNQNGFSVTILTGRGGEGHSAESSNVKIKYLWALDFIGIFRISLIFSILFWLLKTARKDDIIILKPDCLFIAPVLRIMGKKNLHLDIRTVPVNISTVKSRLDRWLFWKMQVGKLHKYVKGLSFITLSLKDAIEDEFGVKFENYVIWQSGVNSDLFNPACDESKNGSNRDYNLLYHGSITRKRGIDTVIRSLALLKKQYQDYVKLIIIGTGSDVERLKRIADESGISKQVIFKGLMPYDKMPGEVAKADIGIYPLPNYPEWNVSSPIKIFEYMASAKPMILTPIQAFTDVLDGQDFVVWTKGYDETDFRDTIEYAYENRESLTENARRGPSIVKSQYDWSNQGAKLAHYLKQTFGHRKNI